MKQKANSRKKYTPNEIFQLIGFNPNTNEFKKQKTSPKNLIINNNQKKCESNNKLKLLKK